MYIHQFSVKNYRSLKDVSVGGLSRAVIFYGDNDSGKSNILSFLEIVFQPKYTEQIIEAPGETFTQDFGPAKLTTSRTTSIAITKSQLLFRLSLRLSVLNYRK